MKFDIVPVAPEHVPELSRICFDAFGALHERHNVPRDFDSRDIADAVVGMMSQRPDFVGFAAVADGSRLIGSNFISFTDPVSGIGPITVDPTCQAKGVGRALMHAVLDEAARRSVKQVRLMQEAVNTASLSLYTSLGFDWRDSIAIMSLAPSQRPDPRVRPMTEADLPHVERLATTHYHRSRRNEVAAALQMHFTALVIESAKGTGISGYLIPGFMGHGFAASHEDMLALMGEAPRLAPPPFHKVLVPLSQAPLYRTLLARGCRTVKVMNYMTVGPYETPRETWIPSIGN